MLWCRPGPRDPSNQGPHVRLSSGGLGRGCPPWPVPAAPHQPALPPHLSLQTRRAQRRGILPSNAERQPVRPSPRPQAPARTADPSPGEVGRRRPWVSSGRWPTSVGPRYLGDLSVIAEAQAVGSDGEITEEDRASHPGPQPCPPPPTARASHHPACLSTPPPHSPWACWLPRPPARLPASSSPGAPAAPIANWGAPPVPCGHSPQPHPAVDKGCRAFAISASLVLSLHISGPFLIGHLLSYHSVFRIFVYF